MRRFEDQIAVEAYRKSAMESGVFETKDCHGANEKMKAKGVESVAPPTESFYCIGAVFRDNSDKWFSTTQRQAL